MALLPISTVCANCAISNDSISSIQNCMDQYLKLHTRRYCYEGKSVDEYGEEVADIKKRFSILPKLMEQYEIRTIDFLMIWSGGDIIVFSNGNIHFFMFEPVFYQIAEECKCSYNFLVYKNWPISLPLKKVIDRFQWERSQVDPHNVEAFSPLIVDGWISSWKYSYLFCAWKTDHGFDCLFAYDPIQPGKKGKNYYRDLMWHVKKMIHPWKRQYLLDRNMIPKEQLPFLKENVYPC